MCEFSLDDIFQCMLLQKQKKYITSVFTMFAFAPIQFQYRVFLYDSNIDLASFYYEKKQNLINDLKENKRD